LNLFRMQWALNAAHQIATTGQTGFSFFFGTVRTTSCALVCFYATARPSARSGAQDLAGADGLVRLEKLLDLVEDP
jgi:hypothetical protein